MEIRVFVNQDATDAEIHIFRDGACEKYTVQSFLRGPEVKPHGPDGLGDWGDDPVIEIARQAAKLEEQLDG